VLDRYWKTWSAMERTSSTGIAPESLPSTTPSASTNTVNGKKVNPKALDTVPAWSSTTTGMGQPSRSSHSDGG